jgi:hypothetical protein
MGGYLEWGFSGELQALSKATIRSKAQACFIISSRIWNVNLDKIMALLIQHYNYSLCYNSHLAYFREGGKIK